MTLGDVIEAALPGLRAEAESLMVDTVLIERKSGATALDPETGERVPTWVQVYAGAARWQVSDAQDLRSTRAGDVAYVVDSFRLDLPVESSGAVAAGDRVTALTCPHDPAREGRRLTVMQDHTKTYATARRLRCQEV